MPQAQSTSQPRPAPTFESIMADFWAADAQTRLQISKAILDNSELEPTHGSISEADKERISSLDLDDLAKTNPKEAKILSSYRSTEEVLMVNDVNTIWKEIEGSENTQS